MLNSAKCLCQRDQPVLKDQKRHHVTSKVEHIFYFMKLLPLHGKLLYLQRKMDLKLLTDRDQRVVASWTQELLQN